MGQIVEKLFEKIEFLPPEIEFFGIKSSFVPVFALCIKSFLFHERNFVLCKSLCSVDNDYQTELNQYIKSTDVPPDLCTPVDFLKTWWGVRGHKVK